VITRPNRHSNPRKEKHHGQPVRVEGERSNRLSVPQDALGLGLRTVVAIETQLFVRMLQVEGLARVSPCEPCEMGYGAKRPGGPLTFAEALLTA